MPKTGLLLNYLGVGILLVTIILQRILEIDPILNGFLLGLSVGMFFSAIIIRFNFLKEDRNKSMIEKEHKLKELEEFIKKHEK